MTKVEARPITTSIERKKMGAIRTKSIFSLAESATVSKFPAYRGAAPRQNYLSDCRLQDDVKVLVKVRIDDHVNIAAMGGAG
jgi:hypothetical protein